MGTGGVSGLTGSGVHVAALVDFGSALDVSVGGGNWVLSPEGTVGLQAPKSNVKTNKSIKKVARFVLFFMAISIIER